MDVEDRQLTEEVGHVKLPIGEATLKREASLHHNIEMVKGTSVSVASDSNVSLQSCSVPEVVRDVFKVDQAQTAIMQHDVVLLDVVVAHDDLVRQGLPSGPPKQ